MIEGSRFVVGSVFTSKSMNDVVKAIRYFPSAVNLAVDWTMFSNIHSLHFYPQGPFSHRVDIAIRVYDQTWTFLGVHCMTAEFSKE